MRGQKLQIRVQFFQFFLTQNYLEKYPKFEGNYQNIISNPGNFRGLSVKFRWFPRKTLGHKILEKIVGIWVCRITAFAMSAFAKSAVNYRGSKTIRLKLHSGWFSMNTFGFGSPCRILLAAMKNPVECPNQRMLFFVNGTLFFHSPDRQNPVEWTQSAAWKVLRTHSNTLFRHPSGCKFVFYRTIQLKITGFSNKKCWYLTKIHYTNRSF